MLFRSFAVPFIAKFDHINGDVLCESEEEGQPPHLGLECEVVSIDVQLEHLQHNLSSASKVSRAA